MPANLDDLMESASQALAHMDYSRCEALCDAALSKARDAADWVMVQRVLLPLQEARRQRRQAALDGAILLGTPELDGEVCELVRDIDQGCIVLTWPYTAADAMALRKSIRADRKPIEVLFADNPAREATWRITSFACSDLSVDLPAPRTEWIGKWIYPTKTSPTTPSHWFMQASEALGNAALASIEATPGSLDYFKSLQQALDSIEDHEILHQRLASAAKALQEARR